MKRQCILFHTIASLLLIQQHFVAAQDTTVKPPQEELSKKNDKSPSECETWLKSAVESDENSSGGLDQDEFNSFVDDITDGAYSIGSDSVDNLFHELLHGKKGLTRSSKAGKIFKGKSSKSSSKSSKLFSGKSSRFRSSSMSMHHDELRDEYSDDYQSNYTARDEIPISGFDKAPDERTDAEEKYAEEFCEAVEEWLEEEGLDYDSSYDGVGEVGTGSTVSKSEVEYSSTSSTVLGGDSSLSTMISATSSGGGTGSDSTTDGTESVGAGLSTMSATTASGEEGITTLSSADSEASTTLSPEDSSTARTTTAPAEGQTYDVSFVGSTNGEYDAADVLNENDNTIFQDVSLAFWEVSSNILSGMGIEANGVAISVERSHGSNRRNKHRNLGNVYIEQDAAYVFESVDTDVTDVSCPSGTSYAASDAECLEFKFSLVPLPDGPLADEAMMHDFLSSLETSIGNGDLYRALIQINPNTEVVGLGSPGDGIPYSPPSAIETGDGDDQDKSVQSNGLSAGGIAGIVVAIVVVLATLAVFVVRRKRKNDINKNREALEDDLVRDDLEAISVDKDVAAIDLVGQDIKRGKSEDRESDDASSKSHSSTAASEEQVEILLDTSSGTPASALAAMGFASTVVTGSLVVPSKSEDGSPQVWM